MYRINLSNSISNILPGDSRKKGGSIDRSVHCVLSRIMHFIRTVMKLPCRFPPPPLRPPPLYFFQEGNDGCLMWPRCARQRACVLFCAGCSAPLPLRVSRENRFISTMRFFCPSEPSGPTSSHASLFIFQHLKGSVPALRLHFLQLIHPFPMTTSPAVRVAGDAGAPPGCLWVKSPISHHSPSHPILQPSFTPWFGSLACFGHKERACKLEAERAQGPDRNLVATRRHCTMSKRAKQQMLCHVM